MNQYYVLFDGAGNVIAFYTSEINGENIPTEAKEITDSQWSEYIAASHLYKLDGELIRKKTQEEVDAETAAQPPRPPSIEERLQATEDALTALLGL